VDRGSIRSRRLRAGKGVDTPSGLALQAVPSTLDEAYPCPLKGAGVQIPGEEVSKMALLLIGTPISQTSMRYFEMVCFRGGDLIGMTAASSFWNRKLLFFTKVVFERLY